MVFEKLKSIFGGGGEEKVEKDEERVKEKESFTVSEVKKKIKNRLEKPLEEIDKEHEVILEEVFDLREEIENVSNSLADEEPSEEVHPNIYKSANEARRLLLNKVNRAIEKIDLSSDYSWDSLLDFNRSLQDAVNLLKNASMSHGGQVSALFEEKITRLKRLTSNLQSSSSELNNSLREAKLRLNDLEELLNEISKREELLVEKEELKTQLENFEKKETGFKEDLEKNKQSLESLKKSQRFEELEENKKKKEELEEKKEKILKLIDSTISELARPLRKMSKMIERDEHMVNKEVLDGLDSYLNNPVKTVMEEEDDLPKFKAVMEELGELLETKMKLSEREREKRIEEVQKILEKRKIMNLKEKYLRIGEEIEELEEERETSPLLNKKERLEKSIQNKKTELSRIKNRIGTFRKDLKDIEEEIDELSEKIKEKADSVLNARIEDL